MTYSGLILLGISVGGVGIATAAEGIDPAKRNEPFSPAATLRPSVSSPAVAHDVQDRRVEKSVRPLVGTPAGQSTAPIEVTETRAKTVETFDVHAAAGAAASANVIDRRSASISTATDTRHPSRVAKYQDALAAAGATNRARIPAVEVAGGAKLNRFVFRKNGPDQPVGAAAEVAIPAGGTRR